MREFVDFDYIKEYAKQMSLKVPDLLAMSPQNDPYYAGTPRDWTMAKWFAEIWQRAGYADSVVHLRRIHYWCVSREVRLPIAIKQGDTVTDEYLNSDSAWKYLTQASKMARYLGLVEIEQIADHKNPDPLINFDISDLNGGAPWCQIHPWKMEAPYIRAHLPGYSELADYAIEVWCEKSTMNDVLLPICRRYHANLVTFMGEASITAVHQMLTKRYVPKTKLRIFYISDFDPAGRSMVRAVARKIEWMLDSMGINADIRLQQIALTPEQVKSYRLPRTPIKDSELRAGRFEDVYGAGAVELDALEAIHPGELANILERAVDPYFDYSLGQKLERIADETEKKAQAAVAEIAKDYQEHIDALASMRKRIERIKVKIEEDFEPELGEIDEWDDEWMFDSARNYFEQLGYYKIHDGE